MNTKTFNTHHMTQNLPSEPENVSLILKRFCSIGSDVYDDVMSVIEHVTVSSVLSSSVSMVTRAKLTSVSSDRSVYV